MIFNPENLNFILAFIVKNNFLIDFGYKFFLLF